jgi:hypothetical protein
MKVVVVGKKLEYSEDLWYTCREELKKVWRMKPVDEALSSPSNLKTSMTHPDVLVDLLRRGMRSEAHCRT